MAAGVDPSLVANPNYVKAAPILRDVEMFDASFFGYSPKDAALMDPQHRLFLEVCWEAFESAGYDPAGCPGKVGVLATAGGVVTSYLLAKLHHADLPGQTASTSHINNDKDFLSTRVSYKFNLKGPSFTIQSACSSSLLAIHQACQTLRLGECDMMLVGGSVVRIPQVEGYMAERRNVHSLDGHCRPFDSVGQGTIFGSGIGAVLLKPLQQAVADRDHIFAVIKGTAANNDGSAKSSYTAPSLGQQSQAVTDALEAAGRKRRQRRLYRMPRDRYNSRRPAGDRSAEHGVSEADQTKPVLCCWFGEGEYWASGASGGNCRSDQNRARASSQANSAEHQL